MSHHRYRQRIMKRLRRGGLNVAGVRCEAEALLASSYNQSGEPWVAVDLGHLGDVALWLHTSAGVRLWKVSVADALLNSGLLDCWIADGGGFERLNAMPFVLLPDGEQ